MSDPGTSAPTAPATLPQVISNTDRQAAIAAIVAAHGEAARHDVTAGVKRVADRWANGDMVPPPPTPESTQVTLHEGSAP